MAGKNAQKNAVSLEKKSGDIFFLLWGYPYVPYHCKMLVLEGRQNQNGLWKNEMACKNE